MKSSFFYLLLFGIIGGLIFLAIRSKPKKKQQNWFCNPFGTPVCTQQSGSGGFTDEKTCLANCSSIPTDLYWTCDSTKGYCVTTKQETPFPYSDPQAQHNCDVECVPSPSPSSPSYFSCETVTGKPLHTGKCLPAKEGQPDTFICPTSDCTSNCPNNTCKAKQCWKCVGASGDETCVQTDCESCSTGCYITDPTDPSTWGQYDSCVKTCGAPSPAPSPPPPPPVGKGWAWSSSDNSCTLQDVGQRIVIQNACSEGKCQNYNPGNIYDSKENCSCCECPQFSSYCPGAQVCAPAGTTNPVCCNGNYCDATQCQACINGQCLDSCTHDENGNVVHNGCFTCMGSTCQTALCTFGGGQCVPNTTGTTPDCTSAPGAGCHCENVTCGKICSPYGDCLSFNAGLNSDDDRWYCQNGGWCTNPTNPLFSYTFAGGSQSTPGKCPDGSQCQRKTGSQPVPLGVQGCWPLGDGLIANLPPV